MRASFPPHDGPELVSISGLSASSQPLAASGRFRESEEGSGGDASCTADLHHAGQLQRPCYCGWRPAGTTSRKSSPLLQRDCPACGLPRDEAGPAKHHSLRSPRHDGVVSVSPCVASSRVGVLGSFPLFDSWHHRFLCQTHKPICPIFRSGPHVVSQLSTL